jgi:RNA-directed DNA polymerase
LAAVEQTKRLAEEWLAGMSLELEPSKTRISHTLHEHDGNKVGFDFLGFEVRQFTTGKTHSGKSPRGELLGYSTIVKPSKEKRKVGIRPP